MSNCGVTGEGTFSIGRNFSTAAKNSGVKVAGQTSTSACRAYCFSQPLATAQAYCFTRSSIPLLVIGLGCFGCAARMPVTFEKLVLILACCDSFWLRSEPVEYHQLPSVTSKMPTHIIQNECCLMFAS